MEEIFARVNEMRQNLPESARLREDASLREVTRRLEGSRRLRRQPAVQALLEDLRSFQPGRRMEAVKAHINTRRDNHVFSLFDASYFPRLKLDYLTYDTLPTDPHLAERYASPTMPVIITGRTEGFGARTVVALFPENHLDGIQRPDDLIFYFIDKFVTRHKRITQKMIDEVMERGCFPAIQGASDVVIQQASSWWVRLHEYHHRQGDMPIPDFLPAKSAKPLAGLEELRVDVSGMLACLHDERLPADLALRTYEFILAERLLRYAVEGIPRPNYDAVASQLLYNYLFKHDGIRLYEGRIGLNPQLPAVLEQFLVEIQRIERRIQSEPVEAVRQQLLSFTNEYTEYDPEIGDYRHIPFFADVKSRLSV